MKKSTILILAGLFAAPSWADVLYDVQITKVYAQSRQESDAHLMQINQTLSSACHLNRLYIDFADKELFATALAKHLAGKNVDIIFVTNAAPKNVGGHTAGIKCKLISIF